MPLDGALQRQVVGHAGPHDNQYAGAIAFNDDHRRLSRIIRGTEGVHSERVLVGELQDLVTGIAGPEIQVYTFLSPCDHCTVLLNGVIQHFAHHGVAVAQWRLYWSEEWIPTALRADLRQAERDVAEAQAAHVARGQEAAQARQALQGARQRAQLSQQASQQANLRAQQAQQNVQHLERQLAIFQRAQRLGNRDPYLQGHITRISTIDLPAARLLAQQAEQQADDAAGVAGVDAHDAQQSQQAQQHAQQALLAALRALNQAQLTLQAQRLRRQNHLNQQAANRIALAGGGWAVAQA